MNEIGRYIESLVENKDWKQRLKIKDDVKVTCWDYMTITLQINFSWILENILLLLSLRIILYFLITIVSKIEKIFFNIKT